MFEAEGGGARLGFMADTVTAGPPGAGYVAAQTKFSVDPDQAQKLISGLEAAVEKLDETKRFAEEINSVGSPGKDIYSGFATMAVQQTAGTEEGGYIWANEQAKRALENTVQKIKDSLAQYRKTDSAAGDALNHQEG